MSEDPLSEDERAELDRLRAAVAAQPGARAPRHRLRSFLAAVLITVGCVLAPLGVASVWLASIAGDTDRYVATVAPLAASPAVQQAVSARAASVVAQHLNIQSLIEQVTPSDRPVLSKALGQLGRPLDSALGSFVQQQTQAVVSSSWFQTFWTNANRQIHTSLNKALTGEGGGLVILTDNSVVIDLAPLIDQVKQRLVGSGLTVAGKIPEIHTSITVLDADGIGRAKTGFRLLQLVGDWLPVVAVLLAAAGVLLAARRRRALVAAALGVAAAVLVLGLVLTVLRALYLDRLPADVSQAAAGDIYDTLLRFLRVGVRTVAVLGVAVALGAWLSGPGVRAGQVRAVWRSGPVAARGAVEQAGLHFGPVGRRAARFRTPLVWAVVAAAALTLALWSYPTGWVVIGLVLATLFAVTVVEFLADPGPGPGSGPGPAPSGDGAPSAGAG